MTIDELLKTLPVELHAVVPALQHVMTREFNLNVFVVKRNDDSVVTGLGVTIPDTNLGTAIVMSVEPEWHVSVVGESRSSVGGWTILKSEADPTRVAKLVAWLLSAESKN